MRVKAGGWPQQGGKNTVRGDVGFTLQRHKHSYEHRLDRIKRNKVTPPVWHAAPFSPSTWNHTLRCEQLCEAATETVRHHMFPYILILVILSGMIKIKMLALYCCCRGGCWWTHVQRSGSVSECFIFKSRLSSNSQNRQHQLLFNFLFCLFPIS